ncbi:signal recognition particle subunit SRP72 [Microdochium nivale]|nr:signal recognition particle subunit SRP72 [Microdochium nivale]
MSDSTATLAKLLGASSIDDHEEILKAANAAIKASKKGAENTDAQHTRVVALLKLDRFDDALRAIAEAGSALESQAFLEKAYALYKTGQHDEADKVLKSGGGSSRASRHLSAQIAYRAERFEAAAKLYVELEADHNGIEGEENDIKINRLAAHAQLEWSGKGGGVLNEAQRQPAREDLEAFETAFNSACGCIARGDLSKASVLLKRARDLCEASEDLTDAEKKTELLPIIIQHAYVLARLGKDAEAAALQKSIELSDIFEAPTRAVASNNQVAISGGDAKQNNPYVTQRLTESATTLVGNDKLFEYQAAALRRNRYALDLQCQKFDGVQRAATKTILSASSSSDPDSTASISEIASLGVISAAARARLQTGKAALHEILPVLEKRPTDIGLLLTIIQLYVQTSNPGPALDLLDAFLKRLDASTTPGHEDVRFAPGLVAVAVALYRLQGRQAAIRNELSRASTYWRSKPKKENAPTTTASSSSLLREAGVELLKSSDPAHVASAGATFEKLVSSSTAKEADPLAVAGLVASFATTDYAKVEPHLASLTTVERLISGAGGIDIETLLSAGVATVPTHSTVPAGKKRAATTDLAGAGAKTTKKRRIRLPKGYVEGVTPKPDPERWLPLRDRSTYRPKGRKGKKRAQESTQGGAVAAASTAAEGGETLELAGGAGHLKVEAGTGGGAGKSKKKKGKK